MERGFLTDDNTDSRAFLGPMAGIGGHTAVASLVVKLHITEEQHRAGGKVQGYALGVEGGQETVIKSPHILYFCLCLYILKYSVVFPNSLPASP